MTVERLPTAPSSCIRRGTPRTSLLATTTSTRPQLPPYLSGPALAKKTRPRPMRNARRWKGFHTSPSLALSFTLSLHTARRRLRREHAAKYQKDPARHWKAAKKSLCYLAALRTLESSMVATGPRTAFPMASAMAVRLRLRWRPRQRRSRSAGAFTPGAAPSAGLPLFKAALPSPAAKLSTKRHVRQPKKPSAHSRSQRPGLPGRQHRDTQRAHLLIRGREALDHLRRQHRVHRALQEPCSPRSKHIETKYPRSR